MNKIKLLLANLFVAFMLCGVATAKDWRGIKPLHSTRADVKRLLGESPDPCRCRYDLEKEVVSFTYSWAEDPCATDIPFFPKVPKNTVLEITVRPKARIFFEDLHFDKSKFKKVGEAGFEYINYFTNPEEGVLVEVEPCDDQVRWIYYQPPADDDTPKCPEGRGIFDPPTPRKFDEYGFIGLKEERMRLDNFAVQLQQEPEAEGYIVVHAGTPSRVSEAQRRAARAKQYLVTRRGIRAERIVPVGYGSRNERVVELIVRPPSIPAPFGDVKKLNCPLRTPPNKSINRTRN
jgi:hypothetical protein